MTENRLALIIANSKYEDSDISQLISPALDANDLAEVLEDPSIGDFKMKILMDEPKHKIEEEIDAFFLEGKLEDLLLLYISCHGIKDKDGHLYFATSNTKRKLLKSTAISDRFIDSVMHSSRSRQQVLFLDCCYSGAFARGLTVKADKNIDIGERFKAEGRVVLTSSNSMQYSFEGDKIKGDGVGSIFTSTIVNGLKTGKADTNKDGNIFVVELYEYVLSEFGQNPLQEPMMFSYGVPVTILIAKNQNLHKSNTYYKSNTYHKSEFIHHKSNIFFILHSSSDDILVDGKSIEYTLNEIMNSKSGKNLKVKVIKKFRDIQQARHFMDRSHNRIIFLVDANKPLDHIGYWELGYAISLGIRIICYKDGKSEIKIPPDIIEICLPISSDYNQLLEHINLEVESLIYRSAEYDYWDNDWESQNTK
jgi:Uncharacterized protein containing caspase domain